MTTGNWDVDFVSVAPFQVNDEKIISDENVVSAITCDFPCKILKNFTLFPSITIVGASKPQIVPFLFFVHSLLPNVISALLKNAVLGVSANIWVKSPSALACSRYIIAHIYSRNDDGFVAKK